MATFMGKPVTDPPQGLFNIGYVRDAMGNVVEISPIYAIHVASVTGAGKRYASADVVMQQCHGGGFLNDFTVLGPTAHTFSSATRWDQCAKNWDDLLNPMPGLENFTRAWRDATVQVAPGPPPPPPPFGFPLVTLFAGASAGLAPSDTGDGTVFQDAFSVPSPFLNCPLCASSRGGVSCVNQGVGNEDFCEYPQYESPDNPPFGNNDLRLLGDKPGQRQFAILVQWNTPENADPTKYRFAINILRVWTTLVQSYGVLGTRIAVLYTARNP
jgi:hypothetical protein